MSENSKEDKIYTESIEKIKAEKEITLEFWRQLLSEIENEEMLNLVISESIKFLEGKKLKDMCIAYLIIFDKINEAKDCFKKAGLDENYINDVIKEYNYTIGKHHLKNREYEVAFEYFNEADGKVEDDDWEKLGYGFLEDDDPDNAEECFYHAGLDENYTIGEYYLRNAEYETAFEYFNEAYTEVETEKWLKLQEGMLREKTFNTDYDYIKKIIKILNEKTIDEEDENNFLKKSHLLIKSNFLLGNIDKAKKALEKIENKNYENADYYYYVGRVYLYSNSIKAKEYFIKALPILEKDKDEKLKNLKSVFPNICNSLGISNNGLNLPIFNYELHETYEKLIFIYHTLKEDNKISETISSFLKIYSLYKELYSGISYYYSSIEEDIKVGIKTLENISELNREREILKNIYLAKMYCKLEDFNNSIKYCDKLLKIDNNNVEGRILRGHLYYSRKASEDYNEDLKIDNNNVEGYMLRGKLYSNKYEKDLEDYNEDLKIDKNNIILKSHLYLIKDYEKALKDYKKALELDALYEGLLNHYIYEIYKSNHIEDIGDTIYSSIDEYLKKFPKNEASLVIKMKEIAFVKEKEKETDGNKKFINMLFKKCLNLEYKIELKSIDEKLLEIYINVEKILNKLQFKYDKQLAHYTTKSSAMAILKEGSKIRLKNSIYANDPEEGKFIKDIIWNEDNNKETDDIDKKSNVTNKEPINTKNCIKNNNIYFTCFSKNINDDASLPMWVHYADRAEGCILVFNEEFFGNDEISIDKKSNLAISSLYEIMYFTDDDIKYIENPKNKKYLENLKENNDKKFLLDSIAKLKESIENFEDKKYIKDKVKEMIEYVSFLFKRSHFEYEKEVRLLKRIPYTDIEKDEKSILKLDEKSIPELYVNFDRSIKCKEVILGSKFSDVEVEKMKMFIDYINEKNKELNCKTVLSKSTLKYR